MPNHVDMDFWVKGNVEELNKFAEFAKENYNGQELLLSANKFIPYPKQYRELDELAQKERSAGTGNWITDGFNSGGYEWCCNNWGTKWGIYDAAIVKQKLSGKVGYIKYNCFSAWSPPIPVILAMSEKFPTLEFKLNYYECGAQYKGQVVAKEGKVVHDEESSYKGRRGG